MEEKVEENKNEELEQSTTQEVEENKYEEVEVYQEVEKTKKEIRTDSYFDGSLIELIGWKVLAFLITIITIGFAAP